MSSANKGAASAMSRWCSHCRPITHFNNFLGAIGVHHLLAFGAGIERTRQDLSQLKGNEPSLPSWLVLNFVYCMLIPFMCTYFTVVVIALVSNEIWRFVEQTVYVLLYIFTFGMFNFSRMNSLYATFMMLVEGAIGRTWHDSVIRLTTPKKHCTLCKAGACRQNMCYSFVKGLLYDELHVNCECFKKHLSDRMELSKEKDGCKTCFEQTDRVTEGKYLWRPSALERYYYDGCGVFDDDVMERHYDMERSMWVSVRLETDDTPAFKMANFRISRQGLDEVVDFPIATPDRLVKMPELRYAFLKNRARSEGESDIVYTPVVFFKRFAALLLATLGIKFASKTYHEEKGLAILLIVTLTSYYATSLLRERVTFEDLGGAESRVSRMLAIDALSSGRNLIKYSDQETSWTRHVGYGGATVGRVDILENILHNRAIVMGDKMVSLSREGIGMYIADVSKIDNSVKGNASEPEMLAEKWRKGDRKEVLEATKGKVPDLNNFLG